ncbi:SIS domain-containing protein [Virgibacillus dokdonensis]|nr:SIS domain-containing protein [Virgibacillus dokdonensis]
MSKKGITDAITSLKKCRNNYSLNIPKEKNLAKQVAYNLYDSVPVIWGVENSTSAVALRWKQQINENTKALAFSNFFPELNHNEIVGFEAPDEVVKRINILMLHSKYDIQQIKTRMTRTKDILTGRVKSIIDINPQGETLLGEIFSLISLGDHISVYLAYLYGNDPSQINYIRYLKNIKER